jgi:LacI family transcriptional regulator
MLQKPIYDMPDAIFAANDLLALGLLQALVADGRLSVPHDISLIGFDDIAFASAAAVPLSSMRQPSRDIGRTALRILLEEVEEPTLPPRQTVYIPQLITRASTRR